MTSICHAIGIDRSTLYRWRAERPEDFCDTPAGILPVDKKAAETADFTQKGVATKAPGLCDPEPEDREHGDLVMVVGPKPKPKIAATSPPAPPAPARRDPNQVRPPSHYLRDNSDDSWKCHIGVDGVIGGGMLW
jgi:hypothetical protein